MVNFDLIEIHDDLVAQYEMEYQTLREEISTCTKMSNEFATFSMTALAAVLAFAFSSSNPLLFLVPFVLIIPLSSKSLYYRKNVAKISAYMIIVLEPRIPGYKWETLNDQYREERSHQRFTIFRNYEYLFESIVCYGLFVFYAVNMSFSSVAIVTGGIVGFIAFAYIAVISYKMAHTGKLKSMSIDKWKQLVDC